MPLFAQNPFDQDVGKWRAISSFFFSVLVVASDKTNNT